MATEIGLDGVVLSTAAVVAWREIAAQAAITLQRLGEMRAKTFSIPDERARINDDGTLTIFVNIPGAIDISMDVPAGHWDYRQ